MATKTEIAAAARGKFLTKEVDLGGVKVTLRELPSTEMANLDARLWQQEADGRLKVAVEGGKELLVPVPGTRHVEEWLAATMVPAFTVAELLSSDWPNSLKAELCREAKKVNGFTLSDAVGNS